MTHQQEEKGRLIARLAKGSLAFFTWPIFVTAVLAKQCFEKNEWPWEAL